MILDLPAFGGSWVSLALHASASHLATFTPGTAATDPEGPVYANAGATIRDRSGWSASLFVSTLGRSRMVDDEAKRLRSSSVVNAQIGRRLSKTTRLSFDVFNVFDHRGGDLDYFSASRLWSTYGLAENYLFNPAEPRGFRVRLRQAF